MLLYQSRSTGNLKVGIFASISFLSCLQVSPNLPRRGKAGIVVTIGMSNQVPLYETSPVVLARSRVPCAFDRCSRGIDRKSGLPASAHGGSPGQRRNWKRWRQRGERFFIARQQRS